MILEYKKSAFCKNYILYQNHMHLRNLGLIITSLDAGSQFSAHV